MTKKKKLFVVCAVDADEVGQIRSGRLRWNRARWDAGVYHALQRTCTRVELLGAEAGRLDELYALKAKGATLVFNLAFSALPLETAFAGCVDFAGLRSTGSGILALALANDKIRSRTLLAAAGIRVPRFAALAPGVNADRIDLTPPVIVKPAHQASSFGISRDSVVMTRRAMLDRARRIWARFGEPAVGDEFVQGREMRVGFIEGRARTFFIAGLAEWSFPGDDNGFKTERRGKSQRMTTRRKAQVPAPLWQEITAIGQRAFHTLGIRGYASLDVRVDRFGRVTVLEVNANPGLSSDSPVWGARGFTLTVRQIVEAALRIKPSTLIL
jgi:D-alanine-D-alanine ligase